MVEIRKRLYVGDLADCMEGGDGWSVVHACRHPCYRMAAAGLAEAADAGPREPWLSAGANLYLDLIDPPLPLFDVAPFIAFLDFAGRRWQRGEHLLIHCNQGCSRAPSLALLFLAKGLGSLPGVTYEQAAEAFQRLLPSYAPAAGIRSFLSARWHEIRAPQTETRSVETKSRISESRS